jgi:hypothetical protein
MQHQKQKPIVDGSELIRALRHSAKRFAKSRSRLLAAGVTDAEIVKAMVNSRTLVSPTRLIGGGRR